VKHGRLKLASKHYLQQTLKKRYDYTKLKWRIDLADGDSANDL
jgi:hypothetical protein